MSDGFWKILALKGIKGGGDTPTQEKTVALDMANGNQIINPDDGKTMTQATVLKPATMVAGNIKSGVDIGGVVGSLVIPPNTLPQIVERTTTELTAEDLFGVTKIGKYAFSRYDGLTKVSLPESVTRVEDYAFYYTELKSLKAPKVDYFGDYSFYGKNSDLTLRNIEGGWSPTLKSIGEYAFCYQLRWWAPFPATLEYIGAGAFRISIWDGTTGRDVVFMGQMPDLLGSGKTFSYVQNLDCRHCTKVPTLQSSENIGWYGDSGKKCIVPDELYDEWINATNWASYTDVTFIKASEA